MARTVASAGGDAAALLAPDPNPNTGGVLAAAELAAAPKPKTPAGVVAAAPKLKDGAAAALLAAEKTAVVLVGWAGADEESRIGGGSPNWNLGASA